MYSSRGVVMAGIEEIRRDFTRLVGYRDDAGTGPNGEDAPAPKGQRRAEKRGTASFSGSDR